MTTERVTPPRRRATQRPIIHVEPSEDTTKTKVVFEDEGNVADIVEQIGGKTVAYQARVKEDETANETENNEYINEFESFNSFDEITPSAPIVQTPLDLMFEDINYAVKTDGLYDQFFAKLLRQPDAISDRFLVPNREIIELGVIQFSSLDRFNFIPAIQETNGNSGGRFSISVYDSNYQVLSVMRGRVSIHAEPRPVGLSLIVPNPQPKPVINNGGNNSDVGLAAILTKITEINQQNHNQLMQVLTRPPQRSAVEDALQNALIQKLSHDIVNPPQPQNNPNNIENTMANVMGSIAVTQAMAEGIARSLNREPPPPPEPDWIDKAQKIADLPIAQQLAGRIMDIGDALAVKGLNLPTDTTQENPVDNMQIQTDETQELILDIINEIESENVFDANNETITELAAEYPQHYADLVATCKSGASFEFIFEQLIKRTANMQPSPFLPYLNLNETQTQQKYVWNEAGVKMQGRLRELYEYLKIS